MTPTELRAVLLSRDIGCVLAFLEPGHQCTDVWGYRMKWDDRSRLTTEHVKPFLRMGRRAKNDPSEAVLLCGGTNVKPPSKVQRALMREYLAQRKAA